MNGHRALVIGICGASNSGKTSLTSSLQKSLPGSSHMCQDMYFYPPNDERLTWIPEIQHHNWELFSALNMDSMVDDVKKWKEKHLQEETDKLSVLLVEGFTIFNYGSRTYIPPDVPGYFDKVVWPYYIQRYNEIKDNSDIMFIPEGLSKEEVFTRVKNDVENFLSGGGI